MSDFVVAKLAKSFGSVCTAESLGDYDSYFQDGPKLFDPSQTMFTTEVERLHSLLSVELRSDSF